MDEATPPPARQRKSKFGSVRQRGKEKFQARYVDANGVRHSGPHMFRTETEAHKWLASVRTDMGRGGWVDPRKGRDTFEAWADDWTEGLVGKSPKTIQGYDSLLRVHVIPYFGRMKIADVKKSTVKRFVAHMDRVAGPGTVRAAYRVVYAILRHAVEDEALVRNPAEGIDLPPSEHQEIVALTAAQVEALADAISNPPNRPGVHYPQYGLHVRFAAYSGLRAAEIVGLRAGRVDLLRGTVYVAETTVVTTAGVMERQPTKNRGRRTVTLPRFLVDQLAEHLGPRAADPDALVFPDLVTGGPHRHTWWYQAHFNPALRYAGLPSSVRFHDLRHTCASLLAGNGAHPREVMEHLGHSTINVTMDRYTHVFPSKTAALASASEDTYRAALDAPIQVAEVRQIGDRRTG